MAIALRYVDRVGNVKERFIEVVYVLDTSSLTLKVAIDTVFSNNNLSMAHVRGQGYDGASNMSGVLNVLKYLILNENNFAHYIYCFAHQLQLVVVVVANKHDDVDEFFEQLALVVTVVCGCSEIGIGETEPRRGLNQEISLVRVGDTRWGSHFRTIVSLVNLFAEVVAVLKYVKDEGSTLSNRNQAKGILSYFKTLDFVFLLHLMLEILCLTDTLSKHLQKIDQNILKAALLVKGTKKALLVFRKSWVSTNLEEKKAQLNGQLDIYYHSLLHDETFFNLKGIADLSHLLVETEKHLSFPLVCRLLKLALFLSLTTATVERCVFCNEVLEDQFA
ncbi:uncharacterized protein LOC128127674 [Lactuca sativa]|uniref:uncharacterized protein LOC128127674 n=1 Tax=Lactuca sativa TaxID=4236 RepID=UPI0022AF717C|nr:uncharacterized protein LOC128127674 [Lactuca sativa]